MNEMINIAIGIQSSGYLYYTYIHMQIFAVKFHIIFHCFQSSPEELKMADTEWKLARRWIISTGCDLDKRSIESSEQLVDFVTSLRDGVILCGVLNMLKPGCVEHNARKIHNVDQVRSPLYI